MVNKTQIVRKLTHAKQRPLALWDRLLTRRVQFLLDLFVLLAAFWLVYGFRFDFAIPHNWARPILFQCPVVITLQFLALNYFGGHNFIWRYTSLAHIRIFLYALFASLALMVLLRLGLPDTLSWGRMPISVAIVNNLLAFGGLLGVRVLRRSIHESSAKQKRRQENSYKNEEPVPVLLIGAGQCGVSVIREMQRQGGIGLEVKGFVDDDPAKQQMSVLHGLKVLGTTEDLPQLVEELDIDHVIITIAHAAPSEFQRILSICRNIPIKVRTIPGWAEVIQGHVSLNQIRDVQIEDLLGRDPVELDTRSMSRFLAARIVMVTGAGGSIGAELARQVLRFEPARLLLVERAEPALFNIDRELRENRPPCEIVPLVADVGDEGRMRQIFEHYRPEVVLHAAAHKHVPLMESNPSEAVKNNVLATRLLGELSGQYGAAVVVLISTDKAVRPSSIMGASKRLAELVVQDLNQRYPTRYAAVRFGNVIGSAGSVVPIFQEQIRKGGPIKITDKRMTRYFMTIPEAAQLVLQAGAIPGDGGEVYVLRMGQPVNILDLAENLIILSGLRPYEEISIIETGRRPGEKLFEELVIDEEVSQTFHPKILISNIAGLPEDVLAFEISRLTTLAYQNDDSGVRTCLSRLITESHLEMPETAYNTAKATGGPLGVAAGSNS